METRLSNIFKTTNVTNLTKVIQQNSYRVLQVTSKWKTLKQPVYFLKAIEFWPTFDIQVYITLAIFREKLQTTPFRKSIEVSQNASTFISIGLPITKYKPFKNIRNLCFFVASFSNVKVADIWNFYWMKYLGKGLLHLTKWGVGVNYCWNYGPSKLLLHFDEYRLD